MIVGKALGAHADARLELIDDEGPCHIALLPLDSAAILGREDREMIVRSNERKIGIAAGERENNGLRILNRDGCNIAEDRVGGRLRLFAAMILVSGGDILGGEVAAVVEGQALPQFEDPLLCTIG